ncbi:MAG: hypothetical protein JO257_14660 [Deltaproteobacteria bacterium]|nr:hypothetical protein [Deltaproteobacteria bacterium]
MKILPFVLLVAACGGSNSPSGGHNPDAPASQMDGRVFMDAPPSVPAMLTIGGTALDNGQNSSTPLAGAAITLKNRTDDMTLATATSDAQGKYSMMVATNGHVVDAYILATKSGYVDAAAFPAKPFEADTSKADSNMITTSNYNLLGVYTGQQSSKGIIIVEVLDAAGMPVMGAAVSSTPASGSVLYSSNSGIPQSGSATNTDGTGFLVNETPGSVMLEVSKSGATFKTHAVNARANTFTSTVVTE